MLKEKIIKDLSGNEYSYEDFLSLVKTFDSKGAEFYIGTDSQIIKNKISIVTCVCACTEKENKIFYTKERISKKDLKKMQMPEYIIDKTKDRSALRLRMLLEAYRSIEAAMEVEPYIEGKLSVHLDIGGTSKSKTSVLQKELQFLVSAQGYECSIKPDSWAASAVADKVAKKRS